MTGTYSFQFLEVEMQDQVATVYLNNPKKANCMNSILWKELGECFRRIHEDDSIRVCVLAGKGKHFSSGIDLHYLGTIMEETFQQKEEERESFLYKKILGMQDCLSAIQHCQKPVIAAVHGVCVGGALDLIAACDIRFCTTLSVFSIMETKLGIVADMGTLQRLRFFMNEGRIKQLAFTSDLFKGYQAEQWGLVNKSYLTAGLMLKDVYELAYRLCELPTYALYGTKTTINAGRDTSVASGLDQVAKLNAKLFLSHEAQEVFKTLQGRLSH
jgi:enoyl-CoA hydratase